MRTLVFSLAARILVFAALLGAGRAQAHEEWRAGMPVPGWVKASCCGPEDVHHLQSSQVRALVDGWHVEGYKGVLAYGRELPSQDGDYWIFYRDLGGGYQSPVYCFFAPAQSF